MLGFNPTVAMLVFLEPVCVHVSVCVCVGLCVRVSVCVRVGLYT